MPSSDRAYERAARRATRLLTQLGLDAKEARLTANASQAQVAKAARVSPSKVSRFEAGSLSSLTLADAVVIADAAGLDLSIKAYPGRKPTRDAGHAHRLAELIRHAESPLICRMEVQLPPRPDGIPEQRAWDATITDASGVTGVELEQRLYDVQAQTRRVHLKWRDSGADDMLLVIAATASDRRNLREFESYFSELPRLRTAAVLAALRSGRRPATGWMLL